MTANERKRIKAEGTKSSVQEHLRVWIVEMNRRGWKAKRLNKRWMRAAFVPAFVETAFILCRIDHSLPETLKIMSDLVNSEAMFEQNPDAGDRY